VKRQGKEDEYRWDTTIANSIYTNLKKAAGVFGEH